MYTPRLSQKLKSLSEQMSEGDCELEIRAGDAPVKMDSILYYQNLYIPASIESCEQPDLKFRKVPLSNAVAPHMIVLDKSQSALNQLASLLTVRRETSIHCCFSTKMKINRHSQSSMMNHIVSFKCWHSLMISPVKIPMLFFDD